MQAKILQTLGKFAGFLIENNLKVTRVVRTNFQSSRVIFRKVTRVESFPKKMKVTRVESESLKNATRVRKKKVSFFCNRQGSGCWLLTASVVHANSSKSLGL